MKKNLIIYGAGTLAEIAGYYFSSDTSYNLIAYASADDLGDSSQSLLNGLPIIPWSEVKLKYPPSSIEIFVAIGYKKTNSIRESRFNEVKKDGYTCASYISSKAIILNSSIGENCFILESNVIQPFVKIGNNSYLWSGNHIGHHSIIEDNVFVTSHVVISGKCLIGRNSFLGVNSLLYDSVSIGEKSIVGAGSIVTESCPMRSVFSPSKTKHRIISRDIL